MMDTMKVITNKLSSEDDIGALESHLYQYSKKIQKIMVIVVLILQCINVISIACRPGGVFATQRRTWYFEMYLILIVVTVLYIMMDFILNRRQSVNFKLATQIQYSYVILLSIWSSGITLLDQLGGNGLNVFIYMTLAAAVLAMLNPYQSILLFGGNFIFLNLLLPYFPSPTGADQTFNNLMNSFFITILAITISIMFYKNRIVTYYDQLIIKKQYEEIIRINEQLNNDLITDNLTKMKNRRYLEDIVETRFEMIREKRGWVGLIMVDIDFFKQYNDHYGHQAGDVCLQKISGIILEQFRSKQTSVIRYGGEEFLVCLHDCEQGKAVAEAEALRVAIEQNSLLRDDIPFGRVTASLGVYEEQLTEDSTLDYMIACADKALYQAKKQGRMRVVVYDANQFIE